MQKYELLLVLPGTFDEKEAENEANKALTIVSKIDGNATANKLGKNRLAYPIRQIRYGYFYTVVFEAEPEKIKDLKTKLTLDKNILRNVITKYNEKMATAQKIVYFSTEGREDFKGDAVEETKHSDKDDKKSARGTLSVPKGGSAFGGEEIREEKKEEIREEKLMDLKDIDKKLDEILADDNLMTKV